jgi:hypothetical protein
VIEKIASTIHPRNRYTRPSDPEDPSHKTTSRTHIHSLESPASKWPYVKYKWVHGCYMSAVQWVHGSFKANQFPEITHLWSDSAIHCSVTGLMVLHKPKSHGFEQLVAVTCPLRAVEMVNGPWRCDERLLWHIFALGSSCLGQY